MMESLTKALKAWDVPRDRVHFESFGAATVRKVAVRPAEGSRSCEVAFNRSGTTCTWEPQSGSLLELADANGVVIDSGCRAGSCGTCLTAIRSGEVRYTTEPGLTVEAGSCLTCICEPAGPLVLDA